jgi:hypothetical protein
MLEKQQTDMQSEDQSSVDEMKALLEEFTTRAGSTSDAQEKSATDLLKQFAETTERSAEKLAKRAEVSKNLLINDFVEFIPVKNLDESRPFEPVAATYTLPFRSKPPSQFTPSWQKLKLWTTKKQQSPKVSLFNTTNPIPSTSKPSPR